MTIAGNFITDLQREQKVGHVSSETEQHLKHEFRKLGRAASGPTLAAVVEAEIDRLERQAAAPVKHLDETGFRIGGKTQWLHIASTILLTFYRISPKRGSLPENVMGVVVRDHWTAFRGVSSR
jgi:hypothetical protein